MAQPAFASHSSTIMSVAAPLLTLLPLEILLHISEHLDALELVLLSRTCRTLCHLGGCKSVAMAFLRSGTAENAIRALENRINRIDLVAELFRHVENQSRVYSRVASIAARLNDLKRLQAWKDEFGYIPSEALIGAARSDRIETFEFVFPHVKIDTELAEGVFGKIGAHENRALLDHLRSNHPEMVTPECLEVAVQYSALSGRFGFALDVFVEISPRSGRVIVDCAGDIAIGAAFYGDMDLFTEFINMYQFDDELRDEIAATSSFKGRMEFIRLQEQSRNAAVWFDEALHRAIQSNVPEVVQFLLGNDDFVDNRFETNNLVQGLRSAIRLKRTEMLPLLLARAHPIALLHDAAQSESMDEAKLLLGGFGIPDQIRVDFGDWEVEFGPYSTDVPDWKMAVWSVIIGLDSDARMSKSNINGAERARFKSALTDAINLARELDLDDGVTIEEMTRFANGVYQ